MARTARNSALETRTARVRLRIRRTPYFTKIAKGLRLGYYRGAVAGSWVARCYRGAGVYATEALGIADDTFEADGFKVLDYWQAQDHARRWGQRQRLIAEGLLREGSYTVYNAVTDYLAEIHAEKSPAAVQGAKYVFDAWVLPDLGAIQVEKLTTDRINRWRTSSPPSPSASAPSGRRPSPPPANRRRRRRPPRPQGHRQPHPDDAQGRAQSCLPCRAGFLDSAWRKVKPFKKVDEASCAISSRRRPARLVDACAEDFRKMVQAALLTGCRYSELARLKAGNFQPR